jgi:hypothetical protein
MNTYDPIHDWRDNIDDYNAEAGKVATPFARKLFIHSALPHEFKKYLKDLSDNGYSRGEVCLVLIDILNEAYDDTETETHQAQKAITPQSFGQRLPNVIKKENGHD